MHSSQQQWLKRVALGTVQFGLDYGISNSHGKVDVLRVDTILKYAHEMNVHVLDTASAYGDSERVLGNVLSNMPASVSGDFELISKFPAETEYAQLRDVFNNTLHDLNQSQLYGYLSHSFSTFQNKKIRDALGLLKAEGLVKKIGVSVYKPEEIDWLLANDIDFDLVQLPYNVFDQRFKDYFAKLNQRNIEVHVRSVFLQGLFFISPKALPEQFKSIQNNVIKLREVSDKSAIPLAALLLNYVLAQSGISKVVLGVTHVDELKANLDSYRYYEQTLAEIETLDALCVTDENIILPNLWKS